MSSKTENLEFSHGFLWQISLLTVVVLAVVIYSTRSLEGASRSVVPDPDSMLFPWLVAGRRTIENGLSAFSGKTPGVAAINESARALAALLIGTIICPTIFLLGWRQRRLSADSKDGRSPLSLPVVFYGLCTATTLYMSAAGLPMAVSGEMARASLRAAQAVQTNRDAIIGEISMLSSKAREHYVLPQQLGGGGRSYERFATSPSVLKTEAAEYVVTPTRREVAIRASSVPFPDCWVEVKLDSTGRLGDWTYGGRFR